MSKVPILHLDHLEVVYEKVILAVRGVSLRVETGQIVALLGANGAGKSTTLKAASRLINAERGEIVSGRVFYQGHDITHTTPDALVRRGLVQVLEGRHCFAHLSVEENLITGALVGQPSRSALKAGLERIYHYFPRLRDKRRTQAGYTSGGEQQMVAIGRALMAQPKLVLLDEPSMGLAPLVVEEIFQIIAQLNASEAVSFLLAEQNANVALRYAQHAYVLENGRVVNHGTAQELAARDDMHHFYFGSQAANSC